MSKLNIALIEGGWSREREVSLKSGEAVYNALDKDKYEVRRYDPSLDLPKLMEDYKSIDLALPILHGKKGEDGSMQGLLDLLNLPYVGSGVLASAMAMNKSVSKKFFLSAGLRVARDKLILRNKDFDPSEILSNLGIPTVIKPVSEGSSIGLKICSTSEEVVQAIKDIFSVSAGSEAMAEEYLNGREVSCAVLGNREPEALPVVEIIPQKEYGFFSYKAKYIPGASKEICPASLSREVYNKIQSCATKAHSVLGCRNFSRSDMIVANSIVYILETNTIPGMTGNSIFPLAARTAGLSFSSLMDRLIELAFED